MSIFSKPLLTCILESLYLQDQLVARLVCKEWYGIIEVLLVRITGDSYELTLMDKRSFGKFIYEMHSYDNHLKHLIGAKNFSPNLRFLSIYDPNTDGYERELFFKLLHYFSDSGVQISLNYSHQDHIDIPVGLNVNHIYLDYLCSPKACLTGVDSPHLESLAIEYDNDSELGAENLLDLASQKFPSLKTLSFTVGCYRRVLYHIASFFKSLKYLNLSFYETEDVFPNVQLDTCLESLSLKYGTYQILRTCFTSFCWKGIKELALIVEDGICPHIDQMFPGIDSLIIQQMPDNDRTVTPKIFYLVGPISVPKLNIDIQSTNLICNYEVKWPAVIRVTFACIAQKAFRSGLNWIFTSLPSIESIILKIPESFLKDELSVKFMKKKKCLSLKCIYSNTKISISLIKLFKAAAPNLLFIACPMDKEIKFELSKLSLAGEDLPKDYFLK